TVVVELVLITIGVVLLVRVVVRRRAFDRIGASVLPPAWRGRTGVLVLVWGGALGAVIILASTFLPDRAYSRVLIAATTNLSFVPLIVLAWWFLMRPSGRGLIESFGLAPSSAGARRLVLVILTLLALGQLGEGVMDIAGRWLGFSAHWTEWF